MRGGERGQATLELLGLVPLLLVVAGGAGQALSAGLAGELADHAAEAGAVALLQDGDPRDAVRRSVPGWARGRMAITVAGSEVRVRLRPPAIVPGLGDLLDAHARASAGATR